MKEPAAKILSFFLFFFFFSAWDLSLTPPSRLSLYLYVWVCVCVALNQEQKKIHLSPVLVVGKSFICSHNRIEYISMPKRIDSCSVALRYVYTCCFFFLLFFCCCYWHCLCYHSVLIPMETIVSWFRYRKCIFRLTSVQDVVKIDSYLLAGLKRLTHTLSISTNIWQNWMKKIERMKRRWKKKSDKNFLMLLLKRLIYLGFLHL